MNSDVVAGVAALVSAGAAAFTGLQWRASARAALAADDANVLAEEAARTAEVARHVSAEATRIALELADRDAARRVRTDDDGSG